MTVAPRRLAPLREFIATENASAVVLLAATVAALAWANSPWSASYERLWATELSLRAGGAELALDLRHWINDGLMAFFFFVVGLEIRREFDTGELRERSRIATPVLAAIGGMALPALIYVALNATGPAVRGWGIAMATDTAFALGVVAVVGDRAGRARTFLLTVVIVDDIIALTVIALAYTEHLSVVALGAAVVLYGIILLLRRTGVRHGVPYFLVGAGVWLATLASGVHATVAGVAVGVLATAYPPRREELERAGMMWRLFREAPTPSYARSASRSVALVVSPNERLQYLFHPWTSYFVVPLFALANAGIRIDGDVLGRAATSPITHGIVAGLVVGKTVGIAATTWLATQLRSGRLPLTVPLPEVAAVAAVSGIGFTVSLLIADISFEGAMLEEAKVGVFAASAVASLLGWGLFAASRRRPRAGAAGRTARPIPDLAEAVDPDVDHVRGPADAPVTLVEYGDFQCPYCGRAEPVLRALADRFGADLAFVFRHLPLDDVHPEARLAAEASEAAHAQGRFWDMHDLLMDRQGALSEADLTDHARSLGLDLDGFVRDVSERRHAARVDRDVRSADASGAAGTPTFFVNGRRYLGAHDLESLTSVVEAGLRERTPS